MVIDEPRLFETVASVLDTFCAYVLSVSTLDEIWLVERLTFEIAFHCV